MLERLGQSATAFLKKLFRTLLTLVAVLAVIAIGEMIGPLRDLDSYIRSHPALELTLQAVTIVMSLTGALILALAQFLPAPRLPSDLSRRKLDALGPPIDYRESGGPRWRAFSGEDSFASVKQAWRLRSWRYHRKWRLLFVMMLGAILLTFGLFGLIFVLGSPGIKLLFAVLLLYATARTLWAFSHAR